MDGVRHFETLHFETFITFSFSKLFSLKVSIPFFSPILLPGPSVPPPIGFAQEDAGVATTAAAPAATQEVVLPAMLQMLTSRSISEGWSEEKTKYEINTLAALSCGLLAAKARAEKDDVTCQQWHPGKFGGGW